jgi:multiple sugar transport system permease protein
MEGLAELRRRGPRAKMSDKDKIEARWGLAFLSPFIIGFLLFYLLPMGASLVFSLLDYNPAVPDETTFVGLENWRRALFEDEEVRLSFWRTLKYMGISLPITLGFSLFVAILMNTKQVVGTNLWRTLFYMPVMIPPVAVVLIWTGVLNEQTGWINVFIEALTPIKAVGTEGIRWLNDTRYVYFAYTAFGTWAIGNSMIIFLAGLRGVPVEVYEAAEIDGANWFVKLIRISIPMITPVIFYQLVLNVIFAMQIFLPAFVLNQGSGEPEGATRFFMVWFYKQSFTFLNMGYGATLAWLMFIFSLVVTVVLFGTSRYWVYYATEEV